MLTSFKHLKTFTAILSFTMLIQSCTLYHKQQYSPDEATQYENTHIRVRTVDGKKYVFNWIDQKDDHILSIKNTKVEYVKKDQIEYVILNNPYTYTTLEEAVNFDGTVFIKTVDFKVKDRLHNHEFLGIQDRGDRIRGIVKTSKDTATVVIPRELISEIQVQNKGASTVASIGTFLGVTFIIGSIIAAIQLSESDSFVVNFN